jgi:hypothetical protein
MKIHQVVESTELKHVIDPIRGMTVHREQVLKPGVAATIDHPEHGTFEINPDGSFDVPDELGEWLCNTPGWYEGSTPFGEQVDRTKAARTKKAETSEK